MAENKRRVRIGHLNTLAGVVSELAKVYRAARRHELDMVEAKSLTYMLMALRSALEAGDIERRLEGLEEAAGQSWQPRVVA